MESVDNGGSSSLSRALAIRYPVARSWSGYCSIRRQNRGEWSGTMRWHISCMMTASMTQSGSPANRAEMRMAPSRYVHDPHRDVMLSTQRISFGLGRLNRSARPSARVLRSIRSVRCCRPNRRAISATHLSTSASVIHDGTVTLSRSPASCAPTVFFRRLLLSTSTRNAGADDGATLRLYANTQANGTLARWLYFVSSPAFVRLQV